MKKGRTRIVSGLLLVAFLLQSFAFGVSAMDNDSMSQLAVDDGTNTTVVDTVANIADTQGTEPTAVVEDETKRDEYTKHYRMSDGGFVAVTYNEPIHYEENNEWKEIDNTLAEQPLSITTHKSDNSAIHFSKNASAKNLVHLKSAKHEVSWSVYGVDTQDAVEKSASMIVLDRSTSGLKSASVTAKDKTGLHKPSVSKQLAEGTLKKHALQAKSKATIKTDENFKESVKGLTKQALKELPTKATSSLVYENALENVDLRYTVSPQKIKEDIVIKAPGTSASYGMDLNTDLNAVLNDDNSIDLNDRDGKTRFHILAPYMYDDKGTASDDIKVELTKTGTGYTMVLLPSTEWLESPDRVYPITIDPTIKDVAVNKTNSMIATYVYGKDNIEVDTNVDKSNDPLFVGELNGNIYRSYVQYQAMPYISGAIADAEFSLSRAGGTSKNVVLGLYRVKNKWSKTMTWTTQPKVEERGSLWWPDDNVDDKTITFSVRDDIKIWYDQSVWGKNKNYGFLIRTIYEENNIRYSFVPERTTLTITYYLETQQMIEGTYHIKAAYTGTYVTQSDDKITQNSLKKEESNQDWRLQCCGDGFYNIFLKSNSNMRLYTTFENGKEVVRVGNEFDFNYLQAKWMISVESGGTYSIVGAYSLSRTTVNALSVENGSYKEGANVLLSAFTGANNQKWELILTDRVPPAFAVTPLVPYDESLKDTISQGQQRWYSFTPSASGYYTFFSSGSGNISGELYSEYTVNVKGMKLLRSDSGSGENNNFLIKQYLQVNSKYYLIARGSGTYTVAVYPYSVQLRHYYDEAYIASNTNAANKIKEYRAWVHTMFKRGFDTDEQTGLRLLMYDDGVEKIEIKDVDIAKIHDKMEELNDQFKKQLTKKKYDPDIGILFTGYITANGQHSARRCLIGLGKEMYNYSKDVRHHATYLHELGHALGASPGDTCMADECIMTYKENDDRLPSRLRLVFRNMTDPDLNDLFCKDCRRQIWNNLELTNKIARSKGVGTSYDTDETPFNGDIATVEDLLNINNHLDKDFQLVNDIDLTGVEMTPIAHANLFTGTLNGNGYKIKNLTISNLEADNIGLFANFDGTIKNLTLENVHVSGRANTGALVGNAGKNGFISNCHVIGESNIAGHTYTGGLVGFNKAEIYDSSVEGTVWASGNFAGGLVGDNYNTIVNCHASAIMYANNYAGGLVGNNRREGYITNCFTTGDVYGINRTGGLVGNNDAYIDSSYSTGDVAGGFNVGGFVGYHEKGQIASCYSTGSVSVSYDYGGGFVGYVDYGEIRQCYALSSVSGEPTKYMGGFIGYGKTESARITNSFGCSSVQSGDNSAGFAGYMNGCIQNCYAVSDNETGFIKNGNAIVISCYFSNIYGGVDAKALAKTSAEMVKQETYADWDFSDVWMFEEESSYPALQGLAKPASLKNIGSTFTTDGIVYKVTSPVTVQVGNGVSAMSVGGVVEIPGIVSNGTNRYMVTNVGVHAFNGCSITSIVIPATVSRIENNAFQTCSSLTKVSFAADSKLQSIGNHAFNGCRNLTSITIPDGVTSLGNNAFQSCTSLTGIVFATDSKLQSIGNHSFNGCSSLTRVDIPDGVTTIGSNAFAGCTALTNVRFGTGSQLNNLSSYAFYNCVNLEQINIPDSVRTIGSYAFTFCKKLTCISIPSGVTALPAKVFYGCSSLTEVHIPESVASIATDTFVGCTAVKLYVVEGSYAYDYAVAHHIDYEL